MERMTRARFAAILLILVAAGLGHPVVQAQEASLTGRWTLNREVSQFPREIGFNADWMKIGGAGSDSSSGGGRGGQSGSSGNGRTSFPISRESRDDAMRRDQLIAEVREPSTLLAIDDTPNQITFTTDKGASRTFNSVGKEVVVQLDGTTGMATARRDGARLVIAYKVDQTREVRYTYSRIASPAQLVVEVQLLDHGKGDTVKRVYEPEKAPAAPPAPTATTAPTRLRTSSPATGVPTAAPRAAIPASAERAPAPSFDQRPDAELKGLTQLGVVVENLSTQAVTCGLKQDAIEAAVIKQLSGAGLKVILNTDEDTYAYVNVMTTTMASGLCISRYDAYLYTHTTARLQYHDSPVLVDVSLMHKGSIAAGAAAAHAESVMKGLQDYVGQFAVRIRDANK